MNFLNCLPLSPFYLNTSQSTLLEQMKKAFWNMTHSTLTCSTSETREDVMWKAQEADFILQSAVLDKGKKEGLLRTSLTVWSYLRDEGSCSGESVWVCISYFKTHKVKYYYELFLFALYHQLVNPRFPPFLSRDKLIWGVTETSYTFRSVSFLA